MPIWKPERVSQRPRCIVCTYPVDETPMIVAEQHGGYWNAAKEARRASEAARKAEKTEEYLATLPAIHLECARKLAIQLLNDIALLAEMGQERLKTSPPEEASSTS